MSAARVAGIVRYEGRMLWRRRGLLAFTVVALAGLALAAFAWAPSARGAVGESAELGTGVSAQLARGAASVTVMMETWPVLALLLMLGMPSIVADVVPRDRQLVVRELIDSTGLGVGLYLAGKLLAVWRSVLVSLAVVALLFGVAACRIHGPFDLEVYLTMWSVGVAPLALFTSGMSTLLAAAQPSRRRTLFASVAFSVYCVAMLVTTTGTRQDVVSLARPTALIALQLEQTERMAEEAMRALPGAGSEPLDGALDWSLLSLQLSPAQIPLTIGLAAAQVGLVWLAAWAWMRRSQRQ